MTVEIVSQKRLGSKGLVVLIALLSAFVPLSTDLYLPALPTMSKHFNTPANLINLTLTLFFIFYAFGTLVWGPLSDKYGRRPVLMVGIAVYAVASALCANAWDIYSLIFFRILQAAGGSTAGTVATAIVKDVYDGQRREKILALVQTMVLLSPAVAPMFGAALLQVTTWRGVFWTLAGIGLLAWLGVVAFEETITVRTTGGMAQSAGRLLRVLRNKHFTVLLVTFSMINIASMSFIASSSYIYVDGFGLSEQVYSYYFTFNAIGLMAGPFLYLQLLKRFPRGGIILGSFSVMALSGVLIFLVGALQPMVFALVLLPASIAGSCLRPPGANLMLEQQKADTGAAASLMGSYGLLNGSLGTMLISSTWMDTIPLMGVLYCLVGLGGLALWLMISRRVPSISLPQIPEPVEVERVGLDD